MRLTRGLHSPTLAAVALDVDAPDAPKALIAPNTLFAPDAFDAPDAVNVPDAPDTFDASNTWDAPDTSLPATPPFLLRARDWHLYRDW
jgi:hypothetical protein